MNASSVLHDYSRQAAWAKSINSFRSTLGSPSSNIETESLNIDSIIETFTTMSPLNALSLVPSHKASLTHLSAALEEAGVDPASLTKKKISLLSFILNILGFVKFDELIDQIIHNGKFVNLKDALATDDNKFTSLVFSILKLIFPQLASLEGIVSGVLHKI